MMAVFGNERRLFGRFGIVLRIGAIWGGTALSGLVLCERGEAEGFRNGPPAFKVFEAEIIGANRPISDLSLDPIGRLVAISGSSLLVYDGSHWSTYLQAKSDTGETVDLFRTITGPGGGFYGSSSLGFHRIEFVGDRHYVLKELTGVGGQNLPNLPKDLREAFVQGDNIYFYGSEQIVCFDPRSGRLDLEAVPKHAKSRFLAFQNAVVEYWTGNYIYVNHEDGRQEVVDTNRSEEAQPDTRSVSAWGDLLALGYDTGLSLYRGSKVEAWPTELEKLPSRSISGLAALTDGYLVVGVRSQGIYLLDKEGEIVQSIGRQIDSRLANTTNLLSTGGNVVWASIDKSVVRIEFFTPTTDFSSLMSYATRFPEVFLHEDRLHLVTDGKLLKVDYFDGGGLRGYIDLLPDWGKGIQSAVSTDEGIVFSDFETIQILKADGSIAKVSDHRSVDTMAKMEGEVPRIVTAGRKSFQLLERTERGDWRFSGQEIPVTHSSFFGVASATGDVWFENGVSKVTRLYLDEGRLRSQAYGPESGFTNAWVNIWIHEGRALFSMGAESKLLWWDDSKGTFSNEVDPMLEALALVPEVARPSADLKGNLYVPTASSTHAVIRRSGTGEVEVDFDTLADLRAEALIRVLPSSGDGVWLVGDTKLFRHDSRFEKPAPKLEAPRIHSVEQLKDGKVIFSDLNAMPSETFTVPFSGNSLVVRVTNPTIALSRRVVHQYLIDGHTSKWMTFSRPGELSLNSMYEGDYTIRIRPTFDEKEFGPESTLRFRVLPPWYRTWWAYLIFSIVVITSVLLLLLLARSRVARRNAMLQRVVDERTQSLNQAVAELGELYEKAKAGDEAKSIFLASVSHEMRTPLNAIIGPAQLLQQANRDPHNEKLIDMVYHAGTHLLDLIDDVIRFAASGSALRPLEAESFDLKELVSELVESISLRAKKKGLSVEFNYETSLFESWIGYPKLVQQVLGNLISNAYKFTETGGHLSVSVESHHESIESPIEGVCISVEDSGIGIPESARERVFEPFQQLEDSRTRFNDGVGLGLSICRQLVARMEGEISFTSEVGKGTIFRLYLPLLPTDCLKGDVPQNPTEQITVKLAGKRLLLVDDEEKNRYVAMRILSLLDIEVDVATNGLEAVEMAGRIRYDVIVMDIRMPRLNGIEASRTIRHSESPNRSTPIIALSAFLSDTIEEECSLAGIDFCIAKPVSCETLTDAVSSAIA